MWLAREGLPADVPRRMFDRPDERLRRLPLDASTPERAAVCNDFLRGFVATCLQGDLGLDRTRRLEPLHEFVLDSAEFEALRACLDASDREPARLRNAVRAHLEGISGTSD